MSTALKVTRDMLEKVVGTETAQHLSKQYGGSLPVYISKFPCLNSRQRELIGSAKLADLCRAFGGAFVFFPVSHSFVKE
ncbi:hypothetical protein [Desulfovibrio inopinatus]|uniref:hypothetical protein n=1 Tax=Desulfovibrio inopinatus TaxID=102109 RepID=UPI0004233D3C|nr:hypothetical protein [Desulfovibrio inopinatus]